MVDDEGWECDDDGCWRADRCTAFPMGTVKAETLVHTAFAANNVAESFMFQEVIQLIFGFGCRGDVRIRRNRRMR